MVEYVEPERFDARTAIFDVRSHRHGEQIRGAVHYDPHELQKADRPSLPVAHDGTIVVYGDDESHGERIASHCRLPDMRTSACYAAASRVGKRAACRSKRQAKISRFRKFPNRESRSDNDRRSRRKGR